MSGKSKRKGVKEDDEVDNLLRSAEDELLLKLTVNSHTTRAASPSSSSLLDPDLHRRFETLKKPSHNNKPPPRQQLPRQHADRVSEDDLFARFAALKGSGSGSGSVVVGDNNCDNDCDGNSEDEVEKVMRWAVDAARLDPPSSDDDDVDGNGDDVVDDDFASDSDDELDPKRKKIAKEKKKKKEEVNK